MEVQLIAAVHFQNIHVILAQTFPFFFLYTDALHSTYRVRKDEEGDIRISQCVL